MDFTKDIKFDNNPTANKDITITYNGFLANSERISIVYGFSENWEHTTESNMSKTENGFVSKIKMLDFDTFNFCFKNNHSQWDNNSCCNYISPILPATSEETIAVENFDIDALIEEILQPLVLPVQVEKTQENNLLQISSEPIDLGIEIGEILSQLDHIPPSKPSKEYSTLEEILSCKVVSEKPIENLENNTQINLEEKKEISSLTNSDYAFLNYVNTYFRNIFEKIDYEFAKKELPETIMETKNSDSNIEEIEFEPIQSSLVPVTLEHNFVISPRKLSKLHTFKKRLKLAFYKAFVKLPKMILGLEKD